MAVTNQTKKILIKVDAGASKAEIEALANQFGILNKNTKSLAGNFGFLTNAFKSWIGFLGIRELTSMSDSMQMLYGQLTRITGSTRGATEAFNGIAATANRTYQSISATGEAFVKFSQVLSPVKANSKEVLSLIETLTNTFRTSRVSTEGTAESLEALSLAFVKGTVSGRELRTIFKSNITLTNLLKQAYGGDIWKKAQEGVININDVMKILSKNQKQINEDAQKLAPTFGQTLTVALNAATASVGNLNEEFGLSSKFGAIVGIVADNLASILTVLAGVATTLALARIPALITGLQSLRVAFTAFAVSNPILLGLTALATVGALIYENWESVSKVFVKVEASFLDFAATVEEKGLKIRQALADATGSKSLQAQIEVTKQGIQEMRDHANSLRDSLSAPDKNKTDDPATQMQKSLDSLRVKMLGMQGPTDSLKLQLSKLNEQYLKDKDIKKYYAAISKFDLYKVNREFKEGSEDIFKYHEQLRDLDISEFNRQLNVGLISLDQFNKYVATSSLKVLNEQVEAGKISWQQYNAEVIKLNDMVRPGSGFYSGVSDYIKSVGNLSQGIARVTTQAFDHLADTLTTFIETGKFQFADFTKAILNDITAMLVRASIVAPIAQGILGIGASAAAGSLAAPAASATTTAAFQYAGAAANGGLMTDQGFAPLSKYANGGIANSPQVALFGEGRTPEAYVPLPDGRNIPVKMQGGSSGVSFTQTIVIHSDGSATADTQTVGQNAKQMADLMKKVALETIIQQKRPGGMIA